MNIQPTTSITYPMGSEVNQLEITINPFTLFPSHVTATWKVFGEGTSINGTLPIPQEIILQWGTDDTIVESYVLSQLGLTKTVIVETTPSIPEEVVTNDTTTENNEIV
jgi:hypothetical protein